MKHNTRTCMCLITLLVVGVVPAVSGQADVPQKINYQGYLTDASGTPITGLVSMTFAVYPVATGGTAIWTETQSVSVANGLYNVQLGAVTPLGLGVQALWAGVLGGHSAVGPITHFDASALATRIAAEVHDVDPSAHFERKEARHMEPFVQYAVIAARQANRAPMMLKAAECYIKAERLDKAKRCAQVALNADPQNPDAAKALLAEIEKLIAGQKGAPDAPAETPQADPTN